MELDKALKAMFSVQADIRVAEVIANPMALSKHMMRLSQYAGIIDEKLAEYQKDYEMELGRKMNQYIVVEKLKPTPAAAKAEMELSETKGQIKYLDKITQSAWRQVGVIQSRINHLNKEYTLGNNIA